MQVDYDSLINKFIRLQRIKRRFLLANRSVDEKVFKNPFITLAREPGSGGAPIAKSLAERLNFTFVDKQILEEIASSTQKSRSIIRSIDEKDRSKIDDIMHSILNPDYIEDHVYMRELTKVILAHALKGNVVILGRGSNYICPFGMGLHVNVVAPYEIRVQRAMDYEGFTRKKATEVIAKVQQERKNFIKQYFKKSVHRNDAYDLIINTNYFNIKQATDIILEAFKHKFGSF